MLQPGRGTLALPPPKTAILKAFLAAKAAPSGQTQHLISSSNQTVLVPHGGRGDTCQMKGGSREPCIDTP